MIRSLRLRRIITGDFRKSEHTLFSEFCKEEKDLAADLGSNDVIAILSQSKSIIYFVHGFEKMDNADGVPRTILHSEKYRITDGAWNPYMMANYARHVGIQLTGIRLFEDHFGYLVNGKPVGGRTALKAVG